MGGLRPLGLSLAAVVAAAAGATPAAGQCRLCDKPVTKATPPDDETIGLDIETSLNFDRLILFGNAGGAASIRPDGSSAVEGGVSRVSARAMVGSALVRGAAGRAIRVELPRRIDLYSMNGGRISVDNVVTDLPSLPRLDAAGELTFRFGGRVSVSGDAEGDYRGDMAITVEYQ